MHTTIAASRQASEAWLTKMVRCLLEPQAASPEPVANRGTPKALTEAQEAEIVRLYDRSHGVSVNALAKQFSVSNPTIDKALRRAGVKN